MVNRVNKDCSATHSVRQTALKLEDDKRKLEEELKEYLEILTTNNTDMNEALVDADGYPRADIDVYQVRHARHKIICIKNDLRKIMHDIEKCLHIVHAENSPGTTENMDVEIIPDTPVARVTAVISGSPASEAGLKVGDLVTHFGSVNSSNFNNLTDISNIVQHSINQLVKVIVLRNEAITKVYLTPRTWSGSGMLGCVLLPFENVER